MHYIFNLKPNYIPNSDKCVATWENHSYSKKFYTNTNM